MADIPMNINPNPALTTLQQVNTAIKTGQGLVRLEQSEHIRKQAEIDRLREEALYARSPRSNLAADQEIMHLQGKLAEAQSLNAQRALAITERDNLILEWMHSNEAFKMLARQYGKIANVSDDQRQVDFANAVVDVAEEDPQFSQTKLGVSKKKQLGLSL